MSGKNKAAGSNLLGELAAMKQDVPTVLAAVGAPSPVPTAPPPPRPAKVASSAARATTTAGKSSAVNLTGDAVASMLKVQGSILAELGANLSASAAICLALEYTARDLPAGKQRLAELAAELRQRDKRRRRE